MYIDRDLDRHLDRQSFEVKKLQFKMRNHWLFSFNNIYFCKCQIADKKKIKEDEQILEELNSAPVIAVRREKHGQLIQTSYIKRIVLVFAI